MLADKLYSSELHALLDRSSLPYGLVFFSIPVVWKMFFFLKYRTRAFSNFHWIIIGLLRSKIQNFWTLVGELNSVASINTTFGKRIEPSEGHDRWGGSLEGSWQFCGFAQFLWFLSGLSSPHVFNCCELRPLSVWTNARSLKKALKFEVFDFRC